MELIKNLVEYFTKLLQDGVLIFGILLIIGSITLYIYLLRMIKNYK